MASKEFNRGAACQRALLHDWLVEKGEDRLAALMYAEIDKTKVTDPLDYVENKGEDRKGG